MSKQFQIDAIKWHLSSRVAFLVNGFLRNELSQKELNELDEWILSSEDNLILFEKVINQAATYDETTSIWDSTGKLIKKYGKGILTIAAVLFLFFIAAWIFDSLFINSENPNKAAVSKISLDSLSLPEEPVLLLNDTDILILNDLPIRESHYPYLLVDKKHKHLQILTTAPLKELIFNNPKGEVWKITLSDGSQILLNANTRIRFPAATHSLPRRLELSGEAFFEVAASKKKPFIVTIGNVDVQAMGTQFNINSHYQNGTIVTSLLKGSLNVQSNGQTVSPEPGASVIAEKTGVSLKRFDEHQLTAWIRNEFVFKNTPIDEALAQISNWYGLNVKNKNMERYHINAVIPFSTPLPDLLILLEKMGHANFSLKGDSLIVD